MGKVSVGRESAQETQNGTDASEMAEERGKSGEVMT